MKLLLKSSEVTLQSFFLSSTRTVKCASRGISNLLHHPWCFLLLPAPCDLGRGAAVFARVSTEPMSMTIFNLLFVFGLQGGGLFLLSKLPFALPWLQIVQEVEVSQELVQVQELHARLQPRRCRVSSQWPVDPDYCPQFELHLVNFEKFGVRSLETL
jgi:hypothetical protein